jgi:hypothetical protein
MERGGESGECGAGMGNVSLKWQEMLTGRTVINPADMNKIHKNGACSMPGNVS